MVGTLEQAVENLARDGSRKEAHELGPYEKDLAGVSRARSVTLPMDSVVNLRRVAEHLRVLANALDDLSRQGDRRTVSIILEAHQAVTCCQIAITESTGKRHYKRRVGNGDN